MIAQDGDASRFEPREQTGRIALTVKQTPSLPDSDPQSNVPLKKQIPIRCGGGAQGFESAAVYPANLWRHLAVTYDGSRLRLYVDGAQAGNRLYTGVALTSDSPLYFGNTGWMPMPVSGHFKMHHSWSLQSAPPPGV